MWIYTFILLIYFLLLFSPTHFFFPTVQHGDPVTHTCIHIFSPIVVLRCKYLDMVKHWIYIFTSLGYISRSGTTGLYSNSMFNTLRNCQTFFKVTALSYIPINRVQQLQFLHSLPNTYYYLPFFIIVILVEVKYYFIFLFGLNFPDG